MKMDPLPPDVAAVLAAERAAPAPAAGTQARVHSRLQETLGIAVIGTAGGATVATSTTAGGATVATSTTAAGAASGGGAGGAATTAAGATAATTATTATTVATTAKVALVLSKPIAIAITSVTVGASIYGGVKLAERESAPPPAITAPAPERGALEPPVREHRRGSDEPIVALAPIPTPTPTPATTSTTTSTSTSTSTTATTSTSTNRPTRKLATSTLADERTLLGNARTALARGDNGGALEALAKHARTYPSGQLAEEREALWIQALVRSGDADAARARAARFRKRYPRSIQLRVIDAALESL